MTASDILAAIQSAPLDVVYFGLRVEDGRTFAVGDYLPNSRIWDDGEPTEDECNGVCTIGLGDDPTLTDIERALTATRTYHGDSLVLVGGKYLEYGQDSGEHIIRKGKCLATWGRA